MSSILIPQELTIWSEVRTADVEFIRIDLHDTDKNENAMNWSEICAVLRYQHPEYRFINP